MQGLDVGDLRAQGRHLPEHVHAFLVLLGGLERLQGAVESVALAALGGDAQAAQDQLVQQPAPLIGGHAAVAQGHASA